MFNFVATNKRLIQGLIILLALTFAAWGIESYTGFMTGTTDVAAVDGLKISERDFGTALRQQQERLRQALGGAVDPATFDTPEARRALLDSLIEQRLLTLTALRGGLGVSDDALREAISAQPAFQLDGKFSHRAYETVLRSQNPPLTPAQFERGMRQDLALAQLVRAVSDTAIVPRQVAERIAAIEGEVREVSEAVIPAARFEADVKLDAGALKAYYDAHLAEFRTPERVRAAYAVLSADAFAAGETIPESELRSAYEARAAQYRVDEQRQVSHILFELGPGAKPAEREAARKKAEQVLAELRKDPGRFAELAKQVSQDAGSAAKGGDLGFFGRGQMLKTFEDAAWRLKQGEISDIVETEAGLHIIRLTAVRAGSVKPFEEVRDELVAELRRSRGARRFAEAAEAFTNTVFEQSDSLQPAAERFKLEVRTTDWLDRDGSGAPEVLNHAKLLAALFSPDAIAKRRNIDALEVSPGTLVSARVLEHQAARQRSFEESRADIERRLRAREAAVLAREEGERRLQQLREGKAAGLAWSEPRRVSRRDPQGMAGDALRRVVSLDAARLPGYAGVAAPQGYTLYRVSRVIPAPEKTDEQAAADLGAAATIYGAAQFSAYVGALRSRADVEINPKNLEKRP